ncbi:MAG: trypsin-like peptidase domain-containing protein, partial [Planctomycetes bacterium]|nr:trypsin-like peptidase domain-containing protein [Planctomycetota bacterium]
MAGVKKLVVAILFLTLPILSFASGAENHANRAVINLTDGSKIVGQILKKDTQKVYVAVAGTVLPLDRKDIKDIKVSGKKEKGFTEIKKTGLYRIGKGTVKPVSAHVERLAPAIVVVKTPSGAGTGWFSNPDGHVITNHHVIARERSITVTAFKKTENNFKRKIYKKVKIIAVSTKMDLALLKIEEDLDLDIPQLYIGDSTKVESGDEVFTIGNPLLLERSTHKGIISKTSRNYEGRLFLQTATPINPGNSGGPLFNERGEVIGVVNMGYIFMEGLGFAIPSKYIIEFLDNVDAFAYDPSNPNTGKKYMEAPIRSTDGAIEFTRDAFLKTGAGIQCLTLADVTGDGAQEVFFVNNNKGEIGIIKGRQKALPPRQILTYEDINKLPPNRDFKLDSIPVHNRIYSLRIADMTGDGIKDIVFYGDLDGLCLIPGKKNGSWGQKRKTADIDVSQARDALRIADIDNDGKNEIFALSKGKFTVVNRGAEHREFPLNAAFWGSIRRYLLRDVNGDGRLDVLFFCTSKQYATRLYVQDEEGNFAREELVESSIQGPVVPYERGDDTLRMLTLEKGRNRIIELTLETDSIKTEKARVTPSVITVALAEGGKATDDFVLADIYGSPAPEILTSSKADNEFLMLHPHQDGIAIVRSPSPRKVTGLALYSREKGENLLFGCSNQDDLF